MSKEQEMRAHFEAWRASGMNRTAFARERKIPINSFHYWCQRFEGKRPRGRRRAASVKAAAAPPQFVEIAPTPVAAEPAHSTVRLRFEMPDGTRITVY